MMLGEEEEDNDKISSSSKGRDNDTDNGSDLLQSSSLSPPASVFSEIAAITTTTNSNTSIAITTTKTNTNNTSCFPCLEQPTRVVLHCNGYYLWGTRNGKVIARKRRNDKDEWQLLYDVNDNSSMVTIQNHKFNSVLSVVTTTTTTTARTLSSSNADGTDDKTTTATTKSVVMLKKEDTKDKTDTNIITNNDEDEEDDNDKDVDVDVIDIDEKIDEEDTFNDEGVPETETGKGTGNSTGNNTNTTAATVTTEELDQQWCFIQSTNNSGRRGVLLQSINTGENLGITNGNLVVTTESDDTASNSKHLNKNRSLMWDIECVTGELCFLSNPNFNPHHNPTSGTTDATTDARSSRIRCDLAGITSLSSNWKGWEVFRLMEVGSGNDNENDLSVVGYVKISSWMHSQWLLCSDSKGNVTTCSHSESLVEAAAVESSSSSPSSSSSFRCSKWAIEKYCPTGHKSSSTRLGNHNNTTNNGVIIRSKTYGRLLCIKDGMLWTYSMNENENDNKDDNDDDEKTKDTKKKNGSDVLMLDNPTISGQQGTADAAVVVGGGGNTTTTNSSSNSSRRISNSTTATATATTNWWSNSIKNMKNELQATIHTTAIGDQVNSSNNNNNKNESGDAVSRKATTTPSATTTARVRGIPPEATIVWDLQAAHLQCYYFLSTATVASTSALLSSSEEKEKEEEKKKNNLPVMNTTITMKSIGPFPNVTKHLRKSDKIQLVQHQQPQPQQQQHQDQQQCTTMTITKLYLVEKQQYICCHSSSFLSVNNNGITATSDGNDEGTDWLMEKPPNDSGDGDGSGSVFRSKVYNCYLSYQEGEENNTRNETEEVHGQQQQQQQQQETTGIMKVDSDSNSDTKTTTTTSRSSSRRKSSLVERARAGRFKNPFQNATNPFQQKALPLPVLMGFSTTAYIDGTGTSKDTNTTTTTTNSNVQIVWKLEPCMPRAVSSEKIKTFALGTSIAVGTTIAMPFALAGVAAVMGAVGAEAGIGFGILAAGLSTAEAVASVGAIGATAYLVFKPADNSLTDQKKEKEGETTTTTRTAWSKRPFSNWRNW